MERERRSRSEERGKERSEISSSHHMLEEGCQSQISVSRKESNGKMIGREC
jgi:hypothetical protein